MADREALLRHLTLGDQSYVDAYIAGRHPGSAGETLDHVGEALVKLGALAATDGSEVTWQSTVCAALDAGLTRDEIVDALVLLMPLIGWTRVVAAAPKVALAMGYDVVAALEAPG